MGLRSHLLFQLSRRCLPEPAKRTVDYGAYQEWRKQSLTASWDAFRNVSLSGLDVLDFGCGDGALSLLVAEDQSPASVTGIDLDSDAIERAREARRAAHIPPSVRVTFLEGAIDGLPVPDGSADVIMAFDCLEHVMSPRSIFNDWFRVLRPGGRCLLEWFPYKGPWGPHMESLIPVPWAHVIFGQEAMFRAAEKVYDLPEFTPRHWDLDAEGNKRPNKWKRWSSFREQGFINELDITTFKGVVEEVGFKVCRLEKHSFGGSLLRRALGSALMRLPLIGEYFVSFTRIELLRP